MTTPMIAYVVYRNDLTGKTRRYKQSIESFGSVIATGYVNCSNTTDLSRIVISVLVTATTWRPTPAYLT